MIGRGGQRPVGHPTNSLLLRGRSESAGPRDPAIELDEPRVREGGTPRLLQGRGSAVTQVEEPVRAYLRTRLAVGRDAGSLDPVEVRDRRARLYRPSHTGEPRLVNQVSLGEAPQPGPSGSPAGAGVRRRRPRLAAARDRVRTALHRPSPTPRSARRPEKGPQGCRRPPHGWTAACSSRLIRACAGDRAGRGSRR
jgi:hypothetical protein